MGGLWAQATRVAARIATAARLCERNKPSLCFDSSLNQWPKGLRQMLGKQPRRDILNPMTDGTPCFCLSARQSSLKSREASSKPESAAFHGRAGSRFPVRWSPRPVFVGAPVLFRSKTYSGPATWLGRRIEFRPDGDVFSALGV